jgi:hypothetical protein
MSYEHLHGLRIVWKKLCTGCGNDVAVIRPGKAQHIASLWCFDCGKFMGWLSTQDASDVSKHIDECGKPGTGEVINLNEIHRQAERYALMAEQGDGE